MANRKGAGGTAQAVEALVKPVVEAMGLRLWDVRFEKEGPDWFLRIYLDGNGRPLDMELCEDIKIGALFKEMYHYIDQAVRLNIYEMFTEALRATRIEMSSSEQKQFVDKYLKTMQMSIADNGDVTLEIRRK